MAANISLSESEVFLELTDGDTAAEIIGYVESITAPASVGRGQQYKLFKFILTNGAQKVVCLMWGEELITEHKDNILLNRIVHIDGARVKMANIGYAKASENFVPYELIIQKNTKLEYHGYHDLSPVVPAIATETSFQDLRDATGLIRVRAHIKTSFASAPSRYGNSTYGVGSVTDGSHKVPVHVSNFAPALTFEKGSGVVIEEMVKVSGGMVTIVVDRSDKIIADPDAEPLSSDVVVQANRLFKRRSEDE